MYVPKQKLRPSSRRAAAQTLHLLPFKEKRAEARFACEANPPTCAPRCCHRRYWRLPCRYYIV